MVIYSVTWFYRNDLAKGKGRVAKNEHILGFSVICRNAKDAISCLDYHFNHSFKNPNGLTVDDGEVVLKRSKIDSRNFQANYMLMDGIREPILLDNLKSNCVRSHLIFG